MIENNKKIRELKEAMRAEEHQDPQQDDGSPVPAHRDAKISAAGSV